MQGDLDDDMGDTARVILKRVKSNVEVRHSERPALTLRLPAVWPTTSCCEMRPDRQVALF